MDSLHGFQRMQSNYWLARVELIPPLLRTSSQSPSCSLLLTRIYSYLYLIRFIFLHLTIIYFRHLYNCAINCESVSFQSFSIPHGLTVSPCLRFSSQVIPTNSSVYSHISFLLVQSPIRCCHTASDLNQYFYHNMSCTLRSFNFPTHLPILRQLFAVS